LDGYKNYVWILAVETRCKRVESVDGKRMRWFSLVDISAFEFSSGLVTLLVECQEGHPACKNLL